MMHEFTVTVRLVVTMMVAVARTGETQGGFRRTRREYSPASAGPARLHATTMSVRDR
jgi:hypothetical protein